MKIESTQSKQVNKTPMLLLGGGGAAAAAAAFVQQTEERICEWVVLEYRICINITIFEEG